MTHPAFSPVPRIESVIRECEGIGERSAATPGVASVSGELGGCAKCPLPPKNQRDQIATGEAKRPLLAIGSRVDRMRAPISLPDRQFASKSTPVRSEGPVRGDVRCRLLAARCSISLICRSNQTDCCSSPKLDGVRTCGTHETWAFHAVPVIHALTFVPM